MLNRHAPDESWSLGRVPHQENLHDVPQVRIPLFNGDENMLNRLYTICSMDCPEQGVIDSG